MTTEKPCSDHPDAPHGFDRNGSHMAGHYVCECSGWTPPASIQEELRSVPERSRTTLEAADKIDALEELNAQLREQNNSVDSACAYLERQIDALEAEVVAYRKCADDAAMAHKVERDALMERVAALTTREKDNEMLSQEASHDIASLEARLVALEKQKPVAWKHTYKGKEVVYYPYKNMGSFYTEITPLYLAAGAHPEGSK